MVRHAIIELRENKVLEQNVFNNTTLSFDDNKILNMSIGYASIVLQECV